MELNTINDFRITIAYFQSIVAGFEKESDRQLSVEMAHLNLIVQRVTM